MNIIIVCIGDWDRFTKPCIDSLQKYEPKVNLIVVDNGSPEPHPSGWWQSVRINETVSYPEALNAGFSKINFFDDDWIMIANNDILFHKPFLYRVKHYDPNSIYGFYTHTAFGRDYISSWAMIFSRTIFDEVGLFDENFKPMNYEDADYCWRAVDKGFYLTALMRDNFGIEHLAKDDRITLSEHPNCTAHLKEKYGIS